MTSSYSDSPAFVSVLGYGFLGKSIVDELASKQYRVSVLCRTALQGHGVSGVEYHIGPIGDRSNLRSTILGGVTVFAVGATSPALAESELAVLAPYELELLDSAMRTVAERGGRFVYLSSSAIYGEVAMGAASETDMPKPISGYGRHKLFCEAYCQKMAEKFDVQLTILRLSNPFGPRQIFARRQGIIGIVLDNLSKNQSTLIRGDGGAIRDYVPVSVLGAVIGLLADNGKATPDIMNVSSGVGLSTRQVLEALERWLGKQIPVQFTSPINGEIQRSVLDPQRLQEWAGSWLPEASFASGLRALEPFLPKLDA